MTEHNTTSQYRIPQPERLGVNKAVEQALRDALEAAPDIHVIDPTDTDRSRTESKMGAATTAATSLDAATSTSPEYFDPTDPAQLLRVGQGTMAMRRYEIDNAA